MSVKGFIKKYNNKYLEDTGPYVSKESNNFQNAFKREMNDIAESIGATLVSFRKGHYDVSGFIERETGVMCILHIHVFGIDQPPI